MPRSLIVFALLPARFNLARARQGARLLHKCAARFVLAVALGGFASTAMSQGPISIEQLLMKESRWQLTSSAGFRSATGASGSIRGRESIGSVALRYGVTPRLEVNAGFYGAESARRSPVGANENRVWGSSIGVNYLLRSEGKFPALLLEGRADISARRDGTDQFLPSGQLALTAYKSVDPVVLSVTAVLQRAREQTTGSGQIQPGSAWRVEPAVNLAVNPQLTLVGGLLFARRHSVRVNGRAVTFAQDELGLRLGVGYAPVRRHSFFITGDLATNQAGNINLQWFFEF